MNIPSNKFDKFCFEAEKAFEKWQADFPLSCSFDERASSNQECRLGFLALLFYLVKAYFTGFLYRLGVLRKLVFSHLILGWFEEFRKFWVEYLGNRPIDVMDFHYLRGSYRAAMQEVVLSEKAQQGEAESFLLVWQSQKNIGALFQAVWKYAKTFYLDVWKFSRFIKKGNSVLEYGCGVAPSTLGLIKYCAHKKLRFRIADIKQINFLFAKWRLSPKKFVAFTDINPAKEDNLPAGELYDVIICLTVFEHLLNPLQVVKVLFNHLKAKGILIFDYVKGEAAGLDTEQGVVERAAVLDFIQNRFRILKGKINFRESTFLTVAQKK